jgi:hypothetical protein
MKIILVLVASCLSLSVKAQTAKVIELTPDESKEDVALVQERKALDEKQQNFQYDVALHHKIALEYPTTASICILPSGALSCDGGPPPKTDHRNIEYKTGWEAGYEFSEDYKYIVPKNAPLSPNFWNGNNLLTPQVWE